MMEKLHQYIFLSKSNPKTRFDLVALYNESYTRNSGAPVMKSNLTLHDLGSFVMVRCARMFLYRLVNAQIVFNREQQILSFFICDQNGNYFSPVLTVTTTMTNDDDTTP